MSKSPTLIGIRNFRKAQGAVIEWGKCRRGVVVTGDNRNDNFERVAAHPCWLKLESVSFSLNRIPRV
jgi:hypothetical protein